MNKSKSDLVKLLHPTTFFFLLLCSLVSFVLVWANSTELEEVIRAQGQVVPATKAKVIQSEYQGKIVEIYVQVGDTVGNGDVLLALSDTDVSTDYLINQEDYYVALAMRQRLEGEINFAAPDFDNMLSSSRPDIVAEQLKVFYSRLEAFQSEQELINNEILQLNSKITELEIDRGRILIERDLAVQEYNLIEPMVKKGYEPRVKLITIEQSIAAFESRIVKTEAAIPAIKLEIGRAKKSSDNLRKKFISEAQENLAQVTERLNKAKLKQSQLENRLENATIVSPVDGIVSKVEVSTIGEIVPSGQTIMEIIPTTDELVLEAEVRPEDVAFVFAGQEARISLSAFDPSIYGFMSGSVQNVAVNTTEKPDGAKFYLAKVSTTTTQFDKTDKIVEILPGMLATIEIKGQNKSVMDYFLNPLKKIGREAFTEN